MTDKEIEEMGYVIGVGQLLLSIVTDDEEWRQAIFNRVSRYIAVTLQIDPLEYTKERADHFDREMTTYIRETLLNINSDSQTDT